MTAACADREDQKTSEHCTPNREAASPDLHCADQTTRRPVVTREQVVHARADHSADHDRYRDRTDLTRVMAPRGPSSFRDLQGCQDAERQHQAVGVQRQWADVHDAVTRAGDEADEHDHDR
jgi:hypothetical protein